MDTLLLVEDTRELAAMIQVALEAAGYRVLYAADGQHAVDLYHKEHPALIILDWMLPDSDGLSVMRAIRETASIPILMLTARAEETDKVVGLEFGADDYVTKPFGMPELIARVRALLRREARIRQTMNADQAPPTTMIQYGILTLDPQRQLAHYDGEPLHLTQTEFTLLHLFVSNPGRAFSRAYLFEVVWKSIPVSHDRSVDHAIARLRKKLKALGDEIEAVWGVGYRLRLRS